MKTLIYLTGPLASGKSTLARSLNSKVVIELEAEAISNLQAAEIASAKTRAGGPVIVIQQDFNMHTYSFLKHLAEELGFYLYSLSLTVRRTENSIVEIAETLNERPLHVEDNNYIRGQEEATKIIEQGKAPLEVLKIKADHRKDVAFNTGWTDACIKENNKFKNKTNSEFLRGYADAKSVLLKGAKAEDIIRPFEENVNYTQFDLGWNKACADLEPLLKQDNILYRANQIVNERSEEKERQYGPFEDSMDSMRDIFNAITGLNLETEHMYKAMIAAKLSRERFSHKEDNLLDLCAYTGSLNNYLEKQGFKK